MCTTFNHICECYDDNSVLTRTTRWMDRVGVHRRKVVLVKDQFLVVRKGGMPLLPSTVPCRVVVDPFGAPSDTPLKMVFLCNQQGTFLLQA